MRLRPYIECKDYDEIKDWITEERTHAMWCANLIKFPIEKGDFERVMKEAAERFGDSPYVATSDDGELIGFFCYSTNLETNEGMLKFVMTNPHLTIIHGDMMNLLKIKDGLMVLHRQIMPTMPGFNI